jgi:hypothetical protein
MRNTGSYVIILATLRYCITPPNENYSIGLSPVEPRPSTFEIDVEDDPVVDVCRRSDRRGRSLVFTCTGEAGADLAAKLKRGSRIFKLGVLLGASIEELTIELGSLLSAGGGLN